ncbi:uncharacterized protein LOC106635844 [Copidosoma floridanum]|uniref:uncharacterized protein LOC106635844 n=1 Tax=Copidosoma floridanum TaxID=29053 RepID=UPI0006C9B36B|nr:uncharacterized protein LOC106635844 [Copidosoma floridanum]
MEFRTFVMILLCASCFADDSKDKEANSVTDKNTIADEPPEGYYAFVESPNAEPPKVRPPPYIDSDKECRDNGKQGKGFVSIDNICGDLNKGYIPRNPMKHSFAGSSYPFELIRNHTLKFLSKALPILKADDSLPKVAKVQPFSQNSVDTDQKRSLRKKRSANEQLSETSRSGRKFCENGSGVVCMLYKAIQGEPLGQPAAERRDEPPATSANVEYRQRTPSQEKTTEYTGPPTPCPAKVEYATPVFAKNYQGVWRYVVQIPYEGYFTQTIEVTRCIQSRCHYLDGGCLSSPRWTSLLVAEIFYPDTFLEESPSGGRLPGPPRDPVAGSPPPVQDFQNYQQYLQKRAGESEARSSSGGASGASAGGPVNGSNGSQAGPHHCDGVDDMGCFQVRLYYDWFLVPGSCKCWRPDYFNRYFRRSNPSPEL